VEGAQHSRRFTFDSVFDIASTQDEVFHYSGIKRLVDMSIEGYAIQILNYQKKKKIFLRKIFFSVDILRLFLHTAKQAVEKHIQ